MPIFEYKALTTTGTTKSDVVTADTPREARLKLQRDRLYVTSLKQVKGGKAKGAKTEGSWLTKLRSTTSGPTISKGRSEEVTTLTRQLATLMKAGIPLAEALKAVVEQAENNRKLHTMLLEVRERVSQGMNLADALAMHPEYFSELYINMVRAGEVSGKLEVVLSQTADFMAKANKVRNKVAAALTYPTVMMVIGGIVVMVLMAFVVPEITKIITGLGKTLPLPTQILITVSDFLQNYWWLPLAILIGVMWIFNLAYQTPEWRYKIDKFVLKVPVVGDLFRKQSVSRFAMTFSALLKTGVPAVKCLEITQNVVNNRVLSQVIGDVRDRIMEGADISTPIKRSGAFPPVVGYMIAVGEQSGQLEEILDRISEAYDEEIDIATQKATALLEPLLIVGLALVVGFIVLSIIWPIMEISQSL